jgi:hypothetical protein
MVKRVRIAGVIGLVVVGTACSLFGDGVPSTFRLRMTGSAGDTVEVIFSKEFVAGRNETGAARVMVFGSDTVVRALPIDTAVDISVEHQLLVLVRPVSTDTMLVSARVNIDDRSIYNDSGLIFDDPRWRYVYQFNKLVTSVVEVVF